MNGIKDQLGDVTWLGVVVDNNDPMKVGRCRIRVRYIFDEIPDEHIPWAHPKRRPDGKSHVKPDVGKVVSVHFFSGDIYSPEYDSAEHYSADLQKKLESVSDYASFVALHMDADFQLWSSKDDGAVFDYAKSRINITKDGDILAQLRDGKSTVLIGDKSADEPAILGNKFMDKFDALLDALTTPGAFISPAGPDTASPDLLNAIVQFKLARQEFLSKHVMLAKNQSINAESRDADGTKGDKWNQITQESEIKFEPATPPEPYKPKTPETINAESLPAEQEFEESFTIPDDAFKIISETEANSNGVQISGGDNASYTGVLNKLGYQDKQQAFAYTTLTLSQAVAAAKAATSDVKLQKAMVSIMFKEQGSGGVVKGFNHNYGGFDIPNGLWKFNAQYHNGYVYAVEGGTRRRKPFVAFKSATTFMQQFSILLAKKGFNTASTGQLFGSLWYTNWNGYGARVLWHQNLPLNGVSGTGYKDKYKTLRDFDVYVVNNAADTYNKVSAAFG